MPTSGVTSGGVASRTSSAGITPPSSLLLAHAPDQIPPAAYGRCLGQRVFAGCRQSLLGDGPSRHYLCNPYVGACTHTPRRPSGALARFFPEDNGLTLEERRSARQMTPVMQLQQRVSFRGCSNSLMFRLLRSLDPPVAPTAEAQSPRGGRAVYTTHRSVGYLPRDVASLRVRHEQLTRRDFHPLDCSLVGCSPFPALSPQSLCRCLDPYPGTPLRCVCSLLPAGQRPHLRVNRFGVHKIAAAMQLQQRMLLGAVAIP